MKRNERNRIVMAVTVVALVAALAGTPAVAGCLKCKVKGFVAACQTGDLDKAIGYLDDDFTFRQAGSGKVIDRDGYRAMLERDLATGRELSYEDLTWEGDIVSAVFTETHRASDPAGVEPRRYRLTFRFHDEKIREQWLEPLPSDRAGLDDSLEP